MKKILIFAALCLLGANLLAFPPIRIELFTEAYVNQLPNMKNFVHPDELARCNRLGISYENITDKCFISYLLPSELQNAKYETTIKNIDDDYAIADLSFPQKNMQKTLFFRNGYYISPVSFHTHNWPIIQSEHFRFIVSSDSLTNAYAIQNLENFLQKTMDLLEFSQTDRNLLKKEKIDYVLCKDAEEIEKISGFNTRGIYLLAQDCIVSIFNSHYHELAHLLINFKLRNLKLFTHPFLQEGFAVAVGSRGGKEPEVLLDMGAFLVENAFLDYTELFTVENFYNVDASISYPVTGLYNRFLIQNIGIHAYLDLYRRFSSSDAKYPAISYNDLPSEKAWKSYFKDLDLKKVRLHDEGYFKLKIENENFKILENKNSYCFQTKGSLLLKSEEKYPFYQSTLFQQKFPESEYFGDKYLILVSEEEVMIYNLFTNNLIADYSSGFTLDFKPVPKMNGFFSFYIPKAVFDEAVGSYINSINLIPIGE